MADLAICPNCGCKLRQFEPRTIGDLSFDPIGETLWAGRAVRTTPTFHKMIGALATAYPRVLSDVDLYDQMESSAEFVPDLVKIQICKLRACLTAAGAPRDLVANVWGRGYRLTERFAVPPLASDGRAVDVALRHAAVVNDG